MNKQLEHFNTYEEDEAKRDKVKIYSSFFYSGCFILVLWIIQFAQWSLDKDLSAFGVLPRKLIGLLGILTAPLVHADFSHLISNSITLFLLFFGILYFYRSSAVKVFFIVYFFDGFLVWLFGRQSYHIGASGLIYGFASFLFFSGVFRKDKRSIALSLLIVFLYGSMVWGILPTDPKISFESHFFGMIVGIVSAFIFKKSDPPPKYDWENEEENEEENHEDENESGDIKIENDAEPNDFRR